MKREALITVILVLASFAASGQRTASGEKYVGAGFVYPFSGGYGGTVSGGVYTMTGYWDAALSGVVRNYHLESKDLSAEAANSHYTATFGYMVRLAATRNRTLNLYAGAGILMGAAQFSTSDNGWEYIGEETGKYFTNTQTAFIYGAYPKIALETFVTSTVAIELYWRAPITVHHMRQSEEAKVFQDITGLVHNEACISVKFNF